MLVNHLDELDVHLLEQEVDQHHLEQEPHLQVVSSSRVCVPVERAVSGQSQTVPLRSGRANSSGLLLLLVPPRKLMKQKLMKMELLMTLHFC